MWALRDWAEVLALLGTEETPALDFKRELGSTKELAKDIAAMTVNGGTLIYGVDEDKKTATATAINKIQIAGTEERVRQVAGTRIAPQPDVEIEFLRETDGDSDGVMVLSIPPSAQAPHQVNERYPRRSGTITTYLEEVEVARLYERRRDLAGGPADQAQLMAAFQTPRPAAQEDTLGSGGWVQGVGRLRVQIQPSSAAVPYPRAPWLATSLRDAHRKARDGLADRLKWNRDPTELQTLDRWEPRGSVGWQAGHSGGSRDVLLREQSSAAVLLYPMAFSFQATWPLDRGEGSYRLASEQEVGVALLAFLAFAGRFFTQVDGVGPIACAASAEHFEGAYSFKATRGRRPVDVSGLPAATTSHQATVSTAQELCAAPEQVGRRLLDSWLVAFFEFDDFWEDVIDPPAAAT